MSSRKKSIKKTKKISKKSGDAFDEIDEIVDEDFFDEFYETDEEAVISKKVANLNGLDMDKMRKSFIEHTHSIFDQRFTLLDNGFDAVLNFGKHRGKTISELETNVAHGSSYLNWLLREKFPDTLKSVIKYRKGMLSALAMKELHGACSANPPTEEKLKGPLFDFDILEWPRQIVDADPKCPRCKTGLEGLIGYSQDPTAPVEEYAFCCSRCAKNFRYKKGKARKL